MSVIDPEVFFYDIQQAAVDILDADAYFDDIPILSEQLGDLDNAIQTVMNKVGMCVVIETPFASVSSANVPAVNFDNIPIVVTIWEDTILNRFNAQAYVRHWTGCSLIALWLLTHSRPMKDGEQIANCFVPEDPTMIDLRSVVDRERFPNVQGCQLHLRCSAGFVYEPQATLTDGNNQALLDGMGLKLTTPRSITK